MYLVSGFFADTVKAKARQTSTMTSIILVSPYRSRNSAGVIRVRYTPQSTTNVVHSRLRFHRRRWFRQVHQLGEDGRIIVESLEDNGIVVQLIDYTESSGENHRTTSLDGVCYSDIHFCRVILYVWGSPPVVSLLLTSAVLSAEYLRLRASIVSPFNAPLLMIRSIHHFFKTLGLPSGEGALAH